MQPSAPCAEEVPPPPPPAPNWPARPFPPVDFPAWTKTCEDLADAIARGPGVVVLVGPAGSGKSLTLARQSTTANRAVDLVDGADAIRLAYISLAKPFAGVRVIAVRPDLLAGAIAAFPDARIVRMRPMTSVDVQAMVDARRTHVGGGPDAITPQALRRLAERCLGNPRRLDQLLGRASLVSRAAGAGPITSAHVDTAAWRMPRQPKATPVARPVQPKATRPSPAPTQALVRQTHRLGVWAGAVAGAAAAAVVAAVVLWPTNKAELPAPTTRVAGEVARVRPDAAPESPAPEVPFPELPPPQQPPSNPTVFVRAPQADRTATRVEQDPGPTAAAEPAPPLPAAPEPALQASVEPAAPASPPPAEAPGQPPPKAQPSPPVASDMAPSAPPPLAETPVQVRTPDPVPAPLAEPAVIPAAVARPGTPENAARLLELGKTLLAIGQVDDAREILKASAGMGNPEAAILGATLAKGNQAARTAPSSHP